MSQTATSCIRRNEVLISALNFTDCNVGHPSERCFDFCDTPGVICAMMEQLQFVTMANGLVMMVTTRARCLFIQALMVAWLQFTIMVRILWRWWYCTTCVTWAPVEFHRLELGHPSDRCLDFCVEFHRLQCRASVGTMYRFL